MELSGQFPVKTLCKILNVNRSGFYKWKKRLEQPSERMKTFVSNLVLFKEYHAKYPSHGYRWLNAKIRPYKVYPNLLLYELNVTGPMQCIVSDMLLST